MPLTSIRRRQLLAVGAAALAAVPFGRLLAQEQGPADEDAALAAVRSQAEELPPIEDEQFAAFIDRFADARVVLLGEESHGTDEFYRARAAITKRLVQQHGFNIVALEADWPDAARMDAYVRQHVLMPSLASPFVRFPAWMWRNHAVAEFLEDLRAINSEKADPAEQAGIYGLDLYSLPSSMDAVVGFLDRSNPEAAAEARERYGCLAPWVETPETYGAMAWSGEADSCSEDVASVIGEVLGRRLDFIGSSDQALFDAVQNARVVASAEAYYRSMYEGSVASWNLRDTHMFETLEAVLAARGPDAKAVVWAHNSHVGIASATQMGEQGEINIGQLVRERYGSAAVSIGFGTNTGQVTAADAWNAPGETKDVRPALPQSVGELMREAGPDRFVIDLREHAGQAGSPLREPRLERFIGVIYLPETERQSHYAQARLAEQFDAYLWLERTGAVEPLTVEQMQALPATHPFSTQAAPAS